MSTFIRGAAVTAALLFALPLLAQQAPPQKYHLELEASPAGVFPYLGKFGYVELHVYAAGVRAEALWIDAFSRNGTNHVTVVNPLARMFMDVPIKEIAPILTRLGGDDARIERGVAAPKLGPQLKGTVGDVPATRHRLFYGPAAFIDVWTTNAIPENPHLRLIVNQLLEGISPGTAKVASKLPGTPLHVEINFRRFHKVTLVKLKKLTMNADDEQDALTLGSLYMRASVLEKLFEKAK